LKDGLEILYGVEIQLIKTSNSLLEESLCFN
jgi:hypothetical protein